MDQNIITFFSSKKEYRSLSNFWEKDVVIQDEICMYKLKTDEIVRQDLLKSGNKTMIHPALRCSKEKVEKNCFWEGRAVLKEGTVVILGKNMLGNIWIRLRDY